MLGPSTIATCAPSSERRNANARPREEQPAVISAVRSPNLRLVSTEPPKSHNIEVLTKGQLTGLIRFANMRPMKVLVLGSGGREHALVRALKDSESVNEIHVAPGNDGMRDEATVHSIALSNTPVLAKLYELQKYDLVVIGPDQALADGLSDFFRGLGARVFGPSQSGAKLEWSKSFAKTFMKDAQIPTADFVVVNSVQDVEEVMERFSPPWVLKADGLALGKGVFICSTAEELGVAAKEIFVEKKFGSTCAIVEEFKPGWELSVHVLTDGNSYQVFPYAQDHKRLLEGNKGPNTGGMGTIAPIPVPARLKETIEQKIIQPAIGQIKKQNLLYRGILFIGIMICEGEPVVLEFNSRFGDPEAQVFLPLLDGDWGEVLSRVADGECPSLKWKDLFATCVVLAAPGYPDFPRKGLKIKGLEQTDQKAKQYFLHAGTRLSQDGFLTHGGRVLNAVGLGSSLQEAQRNAYDLVKALNNEDLIFRRDIGSQFTNSN